MGNMSLRLQCAAGDGSLIAEHVIALGSECYTQIVKEDGGKVRFLHTDKEDDGRLDILGIIHSHQLSVVLEPRVEVGVRSSHSRNAGPIAISPSSAASTFIYLRNGDTVEFQHHLEMAVLLEVENSSDQEMEVTRTTDPSDGQIQVKSSDTQPEAPSSPVNSPGRDSDTDDETVDRAIPADLDRTPVRNSGLMIMETPNQAAVERDPPFSTAPDGRTDDADASLSPTLQRERGTDRQAKRSQQTESQTKASFNLFRSLPIDPTSDSTEAANDAAFSFATKGATLTGSSRGTTPLQSPKYMKFGSPTLDALPEDDHFPSRTSADVLQDRGYKPTPVEEEDPSDNPLTSELDVHDVARVSSERSLAKTAPKRPLNDEEEEEHAESQVEKKRKTRDLRANQADDASERETGELGSPSTAKKGKLRPVSRLGTQESGETITVAQKPFTPNRAGQIRSSPIVSIPSKRGSKTPSSSANSMTTKPPKLLVSSNSIAKKASYAKWLDEQGAQITDKVPSRQTNFICVIKDGELGTTAKVLRSLALGKLVVTDKWVADSKASGHLLPPDDYVHDELQESITLDRRNIFEKKRLYFTSSLIKHYGDGWKDIEALVREAGASNIEKRLPGKVSDVKNPNDILCFGSEEDDPEVAQLINIDGHTVYNKNLLTRSIIDGDLVVNEEEFKLSAPASVPKKRRR